MIRVQLRKARKVHHCGCGRVIKVGHYYLEQVCSPRHEASGGRWGRLAECDECADRYGRGYLIVARDYCWPQI